MGVAVIMPEDRHSGGQVAKILRQVWHGGSRLVFPSPSLPALSSPCRQAAMA